jgi:hypothetical protein
MRNVFDGLPALPNPMDPVNAFMGGLQQAKAEKEEREVRGALTAYAINPDDPAAFEKLAQYRPEIAIQVRGERDKRQQAAQVADLQRRAAGGDRTAMAQLAGIDLDAWDKLADNDRQAATERASVIGQAALRISQLPPEQRPMAWDQAIDQLAVRFPELAEYKGQYSEEALMGAIDSAKLVDDFFQLEKPSYQVIPEGGTLVNTRDPGAVSSFVSGQGAPAAPTSKADYDALAPGAEYVAPDGSRRVKGGAGASRVGSNFLGGF